MRNNCVIIATNAIFLIEGFIEKLRDLGYNVFVAANDNELKTKINTFYPRFIFLEQCFHENATDEFVHDIARIRHNLHIVVWTANIIKPYVAARFIHAGAESYFSLRDSGDNIEKILHNIFNGNIYYPADVDTVLDRDCFFKVNGKMFTKREKEVIRLCIPGKTNEEIADILSISYHTVKFHKSNINRKIGGNKNNDIFRRGFEDEII